MARDQVLQLRATAEQRQLIDQAAAAEGISRTEFILRSCRERARDVLLDRTLFSLTPEQTTALLADLEDPSLRPSPLSASTLLLQLSEPAG
jgi:uncharacterized protein (DUF1778 family)